METLNWIKWCGEFGSICLQAAAVLGGAKVAQVAAVSYAKRRVDNIHAAWVETGRILKEFQSGGGPEQDYFPQFLAECAQKLEEIIKESTALELKWKNDPQTVKKYIWPQHNYAREAKLKINELRELRDSLNSSSVEAYYLRTHEHPLPRSDEILRPSHAKWPEPTRGLVAYTQTMSTGEHRASRQVEHCFTMPAPPQEVQSPIVPPSGLGDGFGSTLPGIRPTGEAAYPYLPRQTPLPGPRSNSMPVPAEFAHFNNVNATPYGQAVPPHTESPYGNIPHAASTAPTYTSGFAYPPHAYGAQYPPSAPRRR